MLIFTKIRVAVPGEWRSRWFTLDTNTLDCIKKHRLELLVESKRMEPETFREWRSLFHQSDVPISIEGVHGYQGGIHGFSLNGRQYCEDTVGNELSVQQGMRIVSGDDGLVVFPCGMQKHDVLLAISENSPVPDDPLSEIQLSQSEVDGFALFLRDIKELQQSEFFERHATLYSSGGESRLETVSVDLIRSFMVIFRRLYMTGKHDIGNFRDSCEVYCSRFWNKRVIDWVAEERRIYEAFLYAPVDRIAGTGPLFSFSNKQLIDVFLYSRFAHQPDPRTTRQLKKMRQEVGSDEWLEFMFYGSVLQAALSYINVSQYISFEMDGYWKIGGLKPLADPTPFCNGVDRGSLPTAAEEAEERLQNTASKLGLALWKQAGCPPNELERFVQDARQHLSAS